MPSGIIPASPVFPRWKPWTGFVVLPLVAIILVARPVFRVSAICACVIAAALVIAIACRKRGNSSLCVEELPVRIGHLFRGEVKTGLREAPADGFWLALNATELVRDADSSSQIVLWADEILVRREDVVSGSEGVRVPFAFEMPTTAKPSTDDVRWVLDVTAPRFGARFPLPVVQSIEPAEVADERLRMFGSVRDSLRE